MVWRAARREGGMCVHQARPRPPPPPPPPPHTGPPARPRRRRRPRPRRPPPPTAVKGPNFGNLMGTNIQTIFVSQSECLEACAKNTECQGTWARGRRGGVGRAAPPPPPLPPPHPPRPPSPSPPCPTTFTLQLCRHHVLLGPPQYWLQLLRRVQGPMRPQEGRVWRDVWGSTPRLCTQVRGGRLDVRHQAGLRGAVSG